MYNGTSAFTVEADNSISIINEKVFRNRLPDCLKYNTGIFFVTKVA